MARKETKSHLVFYDNTTDTIQVFVQVYFGKEKWPLGVLKAPLSTVQQNLIDCSA